MWRSVCLGVLGLKINGHPVAGHAALRDSAKGQKQLWAAIEVTADNPSYGIARRAVLANTFEVTLEGQAHDPATRAYFGFSARGQLINGRVGRDIKADFKSSEFVVIDLT